MYIIELIAKKFFNKKKKIKEEKFEPDAQIQPSYEPCEHVFMPIDSSGETFSCINCGLVVNKKDLSPNNPFNG